ncbi:hypothetical protein BgiMline_005479, partial [Biomphalaria glabrata]
RRSDFCRDIVGLFVQSSAELDTHKCQKPTDIKKLIKTQLMTTTPNECHNCID